MGPHNQNQQPKVVIVQHRQSPAREFMTWLKMAIYLGLAATVLSVGIARLFTTESEKTESSQSKPQKDGLHSKYAECDQFRPKSARRIFCEDEAKNREKQRDWDDYLKNHPRK